MDKFQKFQLQSMNTGNGKPPILNSSSPTVPLSKP